MIHPTALVGPDSVLGDGIKIGAFVVIGLEGPDAPATVGNHSEVRTHSVVYRGVTIGARFATGHGILVREQTEIGSRVSIGSHSVVEHSVRIGDDVRLHSDCFVPEYSELRARAWLGPGVRLTNARYPNRPNTKSSLEGVLIEEDAVLGAAVVILPGVTVGRGALVGAGAVVVKDVAAGSTVVGNPARTISRA